MGVNDAQEMLEAAQDECIRLERENERITSDSALIRDALFAVVAQRDAALAVIAKALSIYEHWNWNDFPTKSDEEQFIQVKRILTQSPASALAKVKADALRDAAEQIIRNPIRSAPAWANKDMGDRLRDEADRIEKETH